MAKDTLQAKKTGKFLSKTFIELFADCGDLSLDLEPMDGIRFINRRAPMNGKKDSSK